MWSGSSGSPPPSMWCLHARCRSAPVNRWPRVGSGGSTRPAARISHSRVAWWWYETRSVSLSDQRRTRVGLVRQFRWQRRSSPGPTHGSTACSTPPACPAAPPQKRSRRSNTAGSSIGRPNAVRAQPGTSPTPPGYSTATRPRWRHSLTRRRSSSCIASGTTHSGRSSTTSLRNCAPRKSRGRRRAQLLRCCSLPTSRT